MIDGNKSYNAITNIDSKEAISNNNDAFPHISCMFSHFASGAVVPHICYSTKCKKTSS